MGTSEALNGGNAERWQVYQIYFLLVQNSTLHQWRQTKSRTLAVVHFVQGPRVALSAKTFVNCCTATRKIAFEMIWNELHQHEGSSKSSEIASFNRPGIIPVSGLCLQCFHTVGWPWGTAREVTVIAAASMHGLLRPTCNHNYKVVASATADIFGTSEGHWPWPCIGSRSYQHTQ